MPQTPPFFIIGGAPRSGTTWFYHALDRHPDLYMAKPVAPEPKFFLVDNRYRRGLDYYRKTWFSDAPAGCLSGEKSTNYLESATAAQRIRENLPDVRLIFILREPCERAYSNYLWSRHHGKETEDFKTALDLEEQRERELPEQLRFARPHAYFSRGLYARLLAPYFNLFPKKQIFCLKQADIKTAPETALGRVHTFLGVPERREDARNLGKINQIKDEEEYSMSDDVRKMLRDRYAEANRELVALLGPEFGDW